ncbi:hypothetical protein GCM10007049_19330 [Echinicola pacifica]|uniref:Spermatogenesis-associated protein 20-like TRX domain-containing protein n=1 Tax=Echinicola pacifica TaxID=346377 RepID=A0A918UQM8_9BACT|nr:thioredoxin domain-containing protein [Echinicola pacifica]GGZ26744.1 hypothetical protein GCM10007049_19330 [Echinicola pacifica]
MSNTTPNELINSQSPYLLQHAHNPVSWYPWSPEALAKAIAEDKPILVSIGYSACHWCHVMERESFEDLDTAKIMNEHFVCIKIDREERPDLDNIYMDSVTAMGLQGGWPLNVFLMPDQRPFYGGTYFPNAQWKGLLKNIAEAFVSHKDELQKSAEGFGRSLQQKDSEKYQLVQETKALDRAELDHMAQTIHSNTDPKWGGMNRAPKFPMPSIWQFLLEYTHHYPSPAIQKTALFTLEKIGMGGIYDQLRGGFARYSVDGEWFAPHFEKMLYDNGQLLSLYSLAYKLTEAPFFNEKITETILWLKEEMLQEDGGFYAALDADSEGVEGKFYTWDHEELEALLGEDQKWFNKLYNIQTKGNWEDGINILFQTKSYEEIAQKHHIPLDEFLSRLSEIKTKLLKVRNLRIAPGLDDKVLSGWNGLCISGLVDAYLCTGNETAKTLAINCGEFILAHMLKGQELFRSYKSGKAYTPAFLEDYAAVIQGFIKLYEIDFELRWLQQAKALTDFTLEHFWDESEGFFYFNNPDAEKLIANKKEIFDNVIPSSNAQMGHNLHLLSKYFYEDHYSELSNRMLSPMRKLLISDPGFLSKWAHLYLYKTMPQAEIAIIGKGAKQLAGNLGRQIPSGYALAASHSATDELPVLAHKVADTDGNALIYVCFDRTCHQPVSSLEEALKLLPNS